MPKRIAWRELAFTVDAEDADTVLSDIKSFEQRHDLDDLLGHQASSDVV